MFPVYWQLEYRDGTVRTEPPEGETILHAPAGAVILRLVKPDNQPVMQVPIPARCRPIFYRNRSAGVGTDIRLDATVFGHGVDADQAPANIELTALNRVWMWDSQRNIEMNVPEKYMAYGAIQHQLTAKQGT